jgi:hypothetical protein
MGFAEWLIKKTTFVIPTPTVKVGRFRAGLCSGGPPPPDRTVERATALGLGLVEALRPKSSPSTVYDLPGSHGPVHIHDSDGYFGGNIQSYDRAAKRELDSYEAAMADYYAQQAGLRKIEP